MSPPHGRRGGYRGSTSRRRGFPATTRRGLLRSPARPSLGAVPPAPPESVVERPVDELVPFPGGRGLADGLDSRACLPGGRALRATLAGFRLPGLVGVHQPLDLFLTVAHRVSLGVRAGRGVRAVRGCVPAGIRPVRSASPSCFSTYLFQLARAFPRSRSCSVGGSQSRGIGPLPRDWEP